ncbi:hypothetical protein [Azospirillum argentinense]|uniref:hypothetical protein n=1 Tax=Azospirillum argentinense TaxID=2970906 RepID=UPI0032DFB989
MELTGEFAQTAAARGDSAPIRFREYFKIQRRSAAYRHEKRMDTPALSGNGRSCLEMRGVFEA